MTTSNKNFRVKNGLEVQGTTATINGNSVLTSASSIDALGDVDATNKTNGSALVYNSTSGRWEPAANKPTLTTSDTVPISGSSNPDDLWLDTTDGRLYVYYQDANTSQWIEVRS